MKKKNLNNQINQMKYINNQINNNFHFPNPVILQIFYKITLKKTNTHRILIYNMQLLCKKEIKNDFGIPDGKL